MMIKLAENQTRIIKESFKISVAISICLLILYYLREREYVWALLTIALIYFSSDQGVAIRRIQERIIGTFIGILAGFLFCNLIVHYNYHWAYLLLITFSAFVYFATAKDQFITATIFITITAIGFVAIVQPSNIDVRTTMLLRLFDTALAGTIIIFCELLIYPKASLVGNKINNSIEQLTIAFAHTLEHHFQYFLNAQPLVGDSYIIITTAIKNTIIAKQYYVSQRDELSSNKFVQRYYTSMFDLFERLYILIERMCNITSHREKIIQSNSIKSTLLAISDILQASLTSLSKLKMTNVDPSKTSYERIKSLLDNDELVNCKDVEINLLIECSLAIAQEIDEFIAKYFHENSMNAEDHRVIARQ